MPLWSHTDGFSPISTDSTDMQANDSHYSTPTASSTPIRSTLTNIDISPHRSPQRPHTRAYRRTRTSPHPYFDPNVNGPSPASFEPVQATIPRRTRMPINYYAIPNVSAADVCLTARDTITSTLDHSLIAQGTCLADEHVNLSHINSCNQPISSHVDALANRHNLRRPRGSNFNSLLSTQREITEHHQFMNRAVIPSIQEGMFLNYSIGPFSIY